MKGTAFRCENHSDREAKGYCCKCGIFLCDECAVTANDPLVYCVSCYEKHVGPVPVEPPVAAGALSGEEDMSEVSDTPPSLKRAAYRVEIHWLNGMINVGTTYSIRTDKRGFFIVPYPPQETEDGEEIQQFVEYQQVKAVYLLKDPSEVGHRVISSEYIPEGHELTVHFKDGNILEGFALGEYDTMLSRFHVIPKDHRTSEYVSVLVERHAIEHVELGKVFRAKELRQLLQGPVRKLLLCCYIDNIGAVAEVDSIAEAIGRTTRIVDRELEIFLTEGLMKEIQGPPQRKVKFLTPEDQQTIQFLEDHNQELHEFYMRQRRLGL